MAGHLIVSKKEKQTLVSVEKRIDENSIFKVRSELVTGDTDFVI